MKIYEYIDFLLDKNNVKSLVQMKKRNYPVKKAYELVKPYEQNVKDLSAFKAAFETGYELINDEPDCVFEIMAELYEKYEEGSVMYGYTTVKKEKYTRKKKNKDKEKISETLVEVYINPDDDSLKNVLKKHFTVVEETEEKLMLKK
jgi:hypothetical protein